MKRLLSAALLLGFFALPVGVAVADDNVDTMIELLRSDLRADKKAIVGASMDLSDADAELFWRHYDAYVRERANLGDRTVDLIKRYPDAVNLTGSETLLQLSNDWFKLQDDRIKLVKKYYKQIEKDTSLRVAVRWLQVEHRLHLLLHLQIAAEIPMVAPIKR